MLDNSILNGTKKPSGKKVKVVVLKSPAKNNKLKASKIKAK